MGTCAKKGVYSRENINRLCEMAVCKNENLRSLGGSVLMTVLTEGLCDAFDKKSVHAYDVMFSQVIDFCRRLPEGKILHRCLNDLGIKNERQMLGRKQRISRLRRFPSAGRGRVKKVIILSRVTLGSDVAVTSVIMEGLKRAFPRAQMVLIGSKKAEELFGADPRVKIAHLGYPRRGGLMERLAMWTRLLAQVKHEVRGLRSSEYFIVDPDSRITQLGLLPLLKDDSRYYFFESRSYRRAGLQRLSELAADWTCRVFPAEKEGSLLPYVRLNKDDLAFGRRICRHLKKTSGAGKLVSVNFGFGGNPGKRVSAEFEKDLLLGLFKAGATVILDKGAAEEVKDINRLVKAVKHSGKGRLFVWEGRVGAFSALIAASSAYVGYDSAFQHIAAALDVPATVVFAGAPCGTFLPRWRSCGRGPVSVIKASGPDRKSHKRLLAKVLAACRKYAR